MTYESDIYTLGFNFDKIAGYVKSIKLEAISMEMMSKLPIDRPELHAVLVQLS